MSQTKVPKWKKHYFEMKEKCTTEIPCIMKITIVNTISCEDCFFNKNKSQQKNLTQYIRQVVEK